MVQCLLLFGALPVWLAWAKLFGGWAVPIIPVLVGLSLLIGLQLARDPEFRWREQLGGGFERADLAPVLRRFAISGALLTLVLGLVEPSLLFGFPRQRPWFWALVMVGYPVLSVLPQEFLYRTYFFHRYEAWLGRWTVPASALAFCVAHLLFGNWVALALTLIGGGFFARTFERTRSLLLASIEHALYGQLVFTIGLGEFFYGGTVRALGG